MDAIQSAIRLRQATDIFDPGKVTAPATEPAGQHGLYTRIGEELAALHRLIDGATDVFSDDPLMLVRHANQLQSIQAASEVLEHLARVLQAADPMRAVDIIALQALRARLLKRSIF